MIEFDYITTYGGDCYRHAKSDFFGVVVGERHPPCFDPRQIVLTLENARGEKKDFPLIELEEVP